MGFCIGGYLVFWVVFEKEIKVIVCCYFIGIFSGKLGKGVVDIIKWVSEIKGEIFIVFGSKDFYILEGDC